MLYILSNPGILFSLLILLLVAILQIGVTKSTYKKIKAYKTIFPSEDGCLSINNNENKIHIKEGIEPNATLSVITNSINDYLRNNKNTVSDFHLIKDIVGRNSEAIEDEINSQLPIPLYLGLAGTMLGILVGVVSLVGTGGLSDLLGVVNTGAGELGIQSLLMGVALAMVSSIVGIFCTVCSTHFLKKSKTVFEKNKNLFLSWMQTHILSNGFSDDIFSSLGQISANLNLFNDEFKKNTIEFKQTLLETQSVNKSQIDLFNVIGNLKVEEIASANIKVYETLMQTTDQIGQLGNYLKNIREFSEEINTIIPKISNYFNQELSQIDQRKAFISEAVGQVDDNLKQVLGALKESAEEQVSFYIEAVGQSESKLSEVFSETEEHFKNQFLTLKETSNTQQDEFKKSISTIESTLLSRLKANESLLDEFKNLSLMKEELSSVKQYANVQNDKIEELIQEVRGLTLETSVTQIPQVVTKTTSQKKNRFISSQKQQELISISAILLGVAALIYIISCVFKWVSLLIS